MISVMYKSTYLLLYQLAIFHSTDVCESYLFTEFSVMRNDNDGSVFAFLVPSTQCIGQPLYAAHVEVVAWLILVYK